MRVDDRVGDIPHYHDTRCECPVVIFANEKYVKKVVMVVLGSVSLKVLVSGTCNDKRSWNV